MNDAHFHLVVNHLPIIIPGIAALVLLGGFIFKSEIVKRTAYVLFIIGSISTLLALNSGEGAEEVVEHLPGVSHDLIHEHEEAAETFAIISHVVGLLSVVGLWANYKRKKFSNIIGVIVLLLGILLIYFGRITGTTGGEITHSEIRADFTPPAEQGHGEHQEHYDND